MTQIVRIHYASSGRESEARGRISSSISSWHGSRLREAAPRRSRFLVDARISSDMRRGGSTSWMSANGHAVLGQGCLGPITIARADTQQCAFLTSDSQWIASCVISLPLSSSRLLSLSFARSTWALSQAPTNELEGSDASAPSMRPPFAGGPRSPLRDSSLSRLSPFLAGRAFLGSFDPPREATLGFDL